MFHFKLTCIIIFGVLFLLPAITFSLNWSKFNFSKDRANATIIESGFENLPDFVNILTTDKPDRDDKIGCSNGLFLGLIDEYVDCGALCYSTNFTYKFVDSSVDNILIDNKKVHGAYCLPKSIAKCNLMNSHALIGRSGYLCVSKFPKLFGGESGNEIIGCKTRRLIDKLLGKIYDFSVPSNLAIDDLDEKIPTGEYRFECFRENDEISLPSSIGSRFETEYNTCNKFDVNGKIDFDGIKCKCDNYVMNDETRECTNCTSGWDVQIDVHGSKYGHVIARDCIDPLKVETYDQMYIPCGPKTLETGKICERALVIATNTYTPMALENIFKDRDGK